jgi:hypothetical protein
MLSDQTFRDFKLLPLIGAISEVSFLCEAGRDRFAGPCSHCRGEIAKLIGVFLSR